MPTDPPFTTPRSPEHRQALLLRTLPVTGHWVFSGAATEWAAALEPYYDLVVFLQLEPALRMDRLRRREAERYGSPYPARWGYGRDQRRVHGIGGSIRYRGAIAARPGKPSGLAGRSAGPGRAVGLAGAGGKPRPGSARQDLVALEPRRFRPDDPVLLRCPRPRSTVRVRPIPDDGV